LRLEKNNAGQHCRLSDVFLASFACGVWQANCYLIAADDSDQAVIVDPGMESAEVIARVVSEHKLKPVAVLATHGHLDHVGNAETVCADYQIPLWIHSADRYMLSDPAAGLGPDSRELVQQLLPDGLREPAEVLLYDEHSAINVGGIEFSLLPAPGHTPGCVMLMTPNSDGEPVSHLVFSGDVLFAGSIGRTDLPGGSTDEMLRSLAGPVLSLPDTAAIFPGHGPQTFMATERANNPYLQPRFLRSEI
jgi:glyoxylase-like metal-dependent hydrolase (beta-lactamase superfamily II)